MENAWGLLSNVVYDGPQPKNLQELEARIMDGVNFLNVSSQDKLKSFFDSIPNRSLTCIKKKGNKIPY